MKISQARTDILFLIAVSSAVLIWNIWTGSLLSWDEGFYGGVSKEIFRTGDWINLYWSGMPWSDKPPLYMWVTTVFYNLFGINEFSVRLFSSLCGIGTVIVTYLLGLKLYGRKTAIASSLVLLSTWHFIWASKVGMLDVTLTFFISLSLLLFELGSENRKLLILSPVVFALAFLTKGLGAMMIPMIIFPYAVLSGKTRKLIDPCFIAGALLAALALIWWHLSVFASYGEDFINDFFIKHLVTRTTTAVDGHTGDFFTYFGVIPNKGRPWSAIGLGLIPILVLMIIWKKQKEHLLPVIWASCVILLFSAVKTKLHWYIMPVYPALALMTGWAAGKIFRKYTIPVISLFFVCFFGYLTVDKDIFNLDYSPNIKAAALGVIEEVPAGREVFLFDISDPGMQFYLGWAGQNIRDDKTLNAVLTQKGVYIFLGKNNLHRLPQTGYTVVEEYPDFILIRS